MDESSSRFRIPKTFDDEKACVISSIPKSTVYNSRTTDGSYIFIENGKAKERTRFAPLSRTECSKMKILIWMCKSCLKERQKSKLLVMQVPVGGCK